MTVYFKHYFNPFKDRQIECECLECNKRYYGGEPVYRAFVSGSYMDFPIDKYYVDRIESVGYGHWHPDYLDCIELI